MRKTTTFIFALLMAAAFTFGAEAPVKKPAVKIGVILPLTGDISDAGHDTRDAMLLYVKEHPSVSSQIKLIFEDDQSIPRGAALAANKLLDYDKVDALVSFYGYGGFAVAPIAERKHILHLGLTHDRDIMKGPYSYGIYASTDTTAQLMCNTVAALDYKKVGIMVGRSQGPLKTLGFLKKYFAQKNILVYDISVLTSERDMRPIILRMKEQNCDLWITSDWPPVSDIFLRQRRELGVNTPITSVISFDGVVDKKAIEGKWYVTCKPPSEKSMDIFKSIGHEIMPISVCGYDGIGFLCDAFITGGGDPVKAKSYLDSLKSAEGMAGHYIVYPDGFFEAPSALVMYRNGKKCETSIEEIIKAKK